MADSRYKVHWKAPFRALTEAPLCGAFYTAIENMAEDERDVTCQRCRKQIEQYHAASPDVVHWAGDTVKLGGHIRYMAAYGHMVCGRKRPRNAALMQASLTDKKKKVTCPGCRARLGFDRPKRLKDLLAGSPDFALSNDKDGWCFSARIRCKAGDEDKLRVLGDVLLEGGWVRIAMKG
jgi:hypothetical protein